MMLLALFLACVKAPPPPQAPSLAPSANVYLRNSFDTDPSSYLGRFLPPGLTDLDESAGMALACSQHVSWRFIDGGGVEYNEVLNVSSSVGARLGVPVVANAQGGASSQGVVRVRYTLTGKMMAEVNDPDALAECCRTQPDQCTDRMVGEFLQGTGEVFHTSSQKAGGSGNAMSPQGVSGGVEFSHGAHWERAATFKNPVYFAFKVNPTPYNHRAVSSCPSWVKSPPTAEHGVYLVGQANEARTEDVARRKALNDATNQAMRAAGAPPIVAAAIAPGLQAESWCVEPKDGRYNAHVLAFVTHEELARTKEAFIAMQQETTQPAAPTPTMPPIEAPVQPAPIVHQAPVGPTAPAAPDVMFPEVPTPPTRVGPSRVTRAPVGPAPVTRTPPTRPAAPPPTRPASSGSFEQLLAQVQDTGFDSEKVKLVVAKGPGLSLTMAQTALLLDEIGFSSSKMEIVEALAPTIQDPQNVELIVDQFGFSSDQTKVRTLFP